MIALDDLKRNGFGYYDPTAYEAIKNIRKKEKEAKKRKKVQHDSKGSKRISSSVKKTGQAN